MEDCLGGYLEGGTEKKEKGTKKKEGEKVQGDRVGQMITPRE